MYLSTYQSIDLSACLPACLPTGLAVYLPTYMHAYMHTCIHAYTSTVAGCMVAGCMLHAAMPGGLRAARRCPVRPPAPMHGVLWVLTLGTVGSSQGYPRYSHGVLCPCLEDCAPRIAAAVRPPLRRLDDRTQRECLGDARALRHGRQTPCNARQRCSCQTACASADEALRRGGAALGTLPRRPPLALRRLPLRPV